ncbi:hypothetical protein pdam_00005142 [Pocillopora damicornis]|uniref:BPL/LPL catalytic domain-containing protein n=1 Tax=Pocillopora damicornis TaxID=46731 RepID=A0A3M6TNF6_POCDA|nr:hypothetical protein pdam_00005142 [Pocillopora damicornis]
MRHLFNKVNICKYAYLKCRALSQWIVYRSISQNPYENLAFEDWLYLNTDLTDRRILFLWRNEPTIVIGRHQNPWAECSLKSLQQFNVHLARRKSGGAKFKADDIHAALLTYLNSESLTALDRQLCYGFIKWIYLKIRDSYV